jgi:hypothetical protein
MTTLLSMSEPDFEQFRRSGVFVDGRISTPALQAVRNETFKRSVESAARKREEIRVAEQKRVEAERLAEVERQRQVEEQRKAEQALLAENARLQAERERPKDGTEEFKQIATFPERYIGQNFYIRGLLYPGSTQRDRQWKCFTIQFANTGAVTGGPYRDRLSFITTEDMGAKIIEMRGRDIDAVVYVNLRYLDAKNESYPVGYVTKIEFYDLDVKAVERYKAITLYENGKGGIHPNPFAK